MKSYKMMKRIGSIRRITVAVGIIMMLITMCLVSLYLPVVGAIETKEIILTVKQIVINKIGTTPTDNSFSYMLTAKNPVNPMPIGSSNIEYSFDIKGTNEQEIIFKPIQSGIYEYILTCISKTKTGFEVDERVYIIKLAVNMDNTYIVVVYTEEGNKVEEISYEHIYFGIPIIPTDPSYMSDTTIRKIVSGNPVLPGIFEFKLTAKNSIYPMPEGSVDGTKVIKIKGQGNKPIGTWSYDREGIYTYNLIEINTKEEGYIYDSEIYTIEDTVTAVDGKLELVRKITNSKGKTTNICSFTNTYTKENTTNNVVTQSKKPITGDVSLISFFMLLMCLSAILIVLTLIYHMGKVKQKDTRH